MCFLTILSCSRTSWLATSSPSSSVVSVKPRMSLKNMVMGSLSGTATSGAARGPLPSPCALSFIPGDASCALKVVAHAWPKRRVSKRLVTTLSSDDATRLEIETWEAPTGYPSHLHADPQDGPERFLYRPHAGGVVELHQDAHLVELA